MVGRAIRARTPKPYVFTKCERVWDANRNVGASLKAHSVRRDDLFVQLAFSFRVLEAQAKSHFISTGIASHN
jgi:hypothetical protein